MKSPSGDEFTVDYNLNRKNTNGRIRCNGQCKVRRFITVILKSIEIIVVCIQRSGERTSSRGPRTVCGVTINPVQRAKDQGVWTMRVESHDDKGDRDMPVQVKKIRLNFT